MKTRRYGDSALFIESQKITGRMPFSLSFLLPPSRFHDTSVGDVFFRPATADATLRSCAFNQAFHPKRHIHMDEDRVH